MKQFFLFLFSFFVLNLTAQERTISGSNSINILKKEIKGNQVSFEIENTSNQPFVAFDVKINGELKKNTKVFIKKEKRIVRWFVRMVDGTNDVIYRKETEKLPLESLNQDIHFNNENSWSSELQFLPKSIHSITIKIENLGNKIEDIDFNFFYPNKTEELKKNAELLPVKAAPPISCSCPIPAYENRADWDPTGTHPAQTAPTSTTVTHLIVHHAAGPNTSSDWAATVRSIWNYHVNSNGWSDIGYNYLIDPNGVIYEGRGDNILGAHFSGMNGGTMGVCLLGNYQPDVVEDIDPSTAMQNSLVELLSWKECDISADPLLSSYHAASSQIQMHISGHRDAGTGTQCPGDNVYDILPNLRNSCASYIPNCAFSADADLIVSALGTNPNVVTIAENTELQVAIGNGGSADVIESINVELKVDAVSVQNFTMDSIHSGEILNFSYTNYVFSSLGNHQLCVYIGSASNETNTANNSYCIDIDVQDPVTMFSDLTVQDISISPSTPEVDELTTLSFDLKNSGDIATSEVVQGKIKIDGITKQLFNIPVLNQNETYTKTFNYTFINDGAHQACIEMNSPSNEDNTANNSFCKSFQIEALTISGLQNIENISSFNLFPNPAQGELNIELVLKKREVVKMNLFNILGQKLYSIDKKKLKIIEKINVQSFERGIYFLEIQLGNNLIKKKIFLN